MIEYAIGTVGGFGLALAIRIARAPLPDIESPSDDAFLLSPRGAPPKRWNVLARLRERVIQYAAGQWGKL